MGYQRRYASWSIKNMESNLRGNHGRYSTDKEAHE